MSNSERFDRLAAMLKEVGRKQDEILAELQLTHEAMLTQNSTLEQMHSSTKRSLSDVFSTKDELDYLLKETSCQLEKLETENREKAHITSILDLLTKP